jgi:dsRNA-specific ribonuclease
MIDGRIASKGRGRTRKTAEQSVARKVLQALRDLGTE